MSELPGVLLNQEPIVKKQKQKTFQTCSRITLVYMIFEYDALGLPQARIWVPLGSCESAISSGMKLLFLAFQQWFSIFPRTSFSIQGLPPLCHDSQRLFVSSLGIETPETENQCQIPPQKEAFRESQCFSVWSVRVTPGPDPV